MDYSIQPMTERDLAEATHLWSTTEGVGLNDSDSKAALLAYLARNPGVSQVARLSGGQLVGAVLCGHDGRRGYLYHLAVAPPCRRHGIGRAMLDACLRRLGSLGLRKCTVFVYAGIAAGHAFWLHNGWAQRSDLGVWQGQVSVPE
jgi:putative acetyltransferase